MKKSVPWIGGIVLVAATLLSASVAPKVVAERADKVDVCHRPPGNPENTRIIRISRNALADHLAHGDHLAFEGACYVYVPDTVTLFGAAEEACVEDFGGHLASIHSQAEDDFVSALVDPDGVGDITGYIGGTADGGFNDGPNASYAWTDGSDWDFANWRDSTGEPNGTGSPGAIQFWPNTNGDLSGWNDVPQADNVGGYVCKYLP